MSSCLQQLHLSGDVANLASSAREALRLDPDDVSALQRLRAAEEVRGNLDLALPPAIRLCELEPDGTAHSRKLGKLLAASEPFAREHASAVLKLAGDCFDRERWLQVVQILQPLANFGSSRTVHAALSSAYAGLMMPRQAIYFARLAVASPECRIADELHLAQLSMEYDDPRQAATMFERVLGKNEDETRAHRLRYKIAICLINAGDTSGGITMLRGLVRDTTEPARRASYLRELVTYGRRSLSRDDINLTLKLSASEGATLAEKHHLASALGESFSFGGDHAKAYTYFRSANSYGRMLLRSLDSPLQRFRSEFLHQQHWIEAGVAPAPREHKPAFLPIFIVGMPRSGSTLVESILAGHRMVDAAGENGFLEAAMQSAAGLDPSGESPLTVLLNSADGAIDSVKEGYLDRLSFYRTNGSFVTDKQLSNFVRIELIRRIWPHSPIIECRRDPLQNCLSIYTTHFTNSRLGYSSDLAQIAKLYRFYADVMNYWKNRDYPDKGVYTMSYEKLIESPRKVIMELFQYCGLDYDDSLLQFHRNSHRVKTASMAQVRKPLYKGSVDLRSRYGNQAEILRLERDLEPVYKLYGD